MTALDILKKHQDPDKVLLTQVEALAALREITEKTWEEAINYDRYQHPYPSKDEFLKELFPEK